MRFETFLWTFCDSGDKTKSLEPCGSALRSWFMMVRNIFAIWDLFFLSVSSHKSSKHFSLSCWFLVSARLNVLSSKTEGEIQRRVDLDILTWSTRRHQPCAFLGWNALLHEGAPSSHRGKLQQTWRHFDERERLKLCWCFWQLRLEYRPTAKAAVLSSQ